VNLRVPVNTAIPTKFRDDKPVYQAQMQSRSESRWTCEGGTGIHGSTLKCSRRRPSSRVAVGLASDHAPDPAL